MKTTILQLAVEITVKAMGADQATTNWIGGDANVIKFLNNVALALHKLDQGELPQAQ